MSLSILLWQLERLQTLSAVSQIPVSHMIREAIVEWLARHHPTIALDPSGEEGTR